MTYRDEPNSPPAPASAVTTSKPSNSRLVAVAVAGGLLCIALGVVVGVVASRGVKWPTIGVGKGTRGVVILRESASATPAMRELIVTLRNGEPEKYISEHKHTLLILDKDSKDPNEQSVVKDWLPLAPKLPALLIYDLPSRKILDKRELPDGTTAAQVIDWLKAKGG